MLNKTAIITGAGGLLGIEHAIALNEIGFSIVMIDINKKDLEKNYNLLKKINQKNKKKILSFVGDVTNEKILVQILKKIRSKNLVITALVNNAEKNPKMKKFNQKVQGKIKDYNISSLRKDIDVGIIGTFACIKVFGQHMVDNKIKGTIVNVSSDLGICAPDQRVYSPKDEIKSIGGFKPISYTISKHAIIGISKYVATYWGHKNIRCNTLVPGAVKNNQPLFLINNVKKRIPLNRWAKKNEYRKALQFLCTNDSSYMTGQCLIMDGGRTIW